MAKNFKVMFKLENVLKVVVLSVVVLSLLVITFDVVMNGAKML